MAFSCFPHISKHVELDDGTRYAYAYVEPATADKPTFLFIHGFPSSSYDWRHQVEALTSKGFGVVVPDLLGYGDTDSPTEVEAYSMKTMSGHLAEILTKQGIKKVIGVGHDWGSGLLSRFIVWHPEYLVAAIFVAVGYIAPTGAPFDVDGFNAMTEKALGYPIFGYWKLFKSEEAGKLLDNHPDSTSSLVYPTDPEIWKVHFAPIGAAEAWITENKITDPAAWLTADEVATHKKILGQKGYTGPLNWYKGAIKGIDAEHETSLSEESKHVNVPTLLIVAEKDCVCLPEIQKQGSAPWVKQLRVETFPCGHWVQLEMPEKLNELLVEFATGL